VLDGCHLVDAITCTGQVTVTEDDRFPTTSAVQSTHTEPASDVSSVKAAVPGTFNPCAADEIMPNATGDIIRLTAGSQLHAA
jgi:hypothetical protein